MRILLTGANGYIGMRLLPALLAEGHTVICCVRDKSRFPIETNTEEGLMVVEGDFLRKGSLTNLPVNLDAAYYLIHSMNDRTGNFSDMESESAQNFIEYIRNTTVKQVIYLSGIANNQELSEH